MFNSICGCLLLSGCNMSHGCISSLFRLKSIQWGTITLPKQACNKNMYINRRIPLLNNWGHRAQLQSYSMCESVPKMATKGQGATVLLRHSDNNENKRPEFMKLSMRPKHMGLSSDRQVAAIIWGTNIREESWNILFSVCGTNLALHYTLPGANRGCMNSF